MDYFVVDKQRQPNDIIFRPNDLICDYNGELINNNTKQARYANHNSPYAVQISNNNIYWFDSFGCPPMQNEVNIFKQNHYNVYYSSVQIQLFYELY